MPRIARGCPRESKQAVFVSLHRAGGGSHSTSRDLAVVGRRGLDRGSGRAHVNTANRDVGFFDSLAFPQELAGTACQSPPQNTLSRFNGTAALCKPS